jgi:putative inorganic carbon (hco3(-)) transporter
VLQAIKSLRSDLLLFGATLVVILIYFLNFFYDLNNLVTAISLLLLTLFGTVLVLRYKQFLLYSLAFLIPISFPLKISGETRISIPSELVCVLLTIFFFVKLWQGKKISAGFLKHPVTILIILDVCWLLISSVASEMPLVSLKRVIIKLMYYISFYYFYYELFSFDQKNIRKLLLVHCVGFLIPVINATVFHAGLGFTTMGSQLSSAPFYNDHTMYGAALVFFIPFLFFSCFKAFSPKSNSVLAFVLLVIFCGAAFLSYSRAAWLSLIVCAFIGILILLRPKLYHFAILSIIIISALFVFSDAVNDYFLRSKQVSHNNDIGMHFKSISNINSDASNMERVNRWKCAIRMFEDKPVFGFGPGTYQFFYGSYQVRKDMTHISTFHGTKGHAHSEYLNYLSETGLPGCMIFISLVISVIVTAIKLLNNLKDKYYKYLVIGIFLGLITFFVHAFFNGFIESDKIAMPVFMSIAALVSIDLKLKENYTGKI